MSSPDRPEGHDTVIAKGECPKCGSSKGFVTYADGHAHCFGAGCSHYVPASEAGTARSSFKASNSTGRAMELPSALSSTPPTLAKRGLSADTLRQYRVYEYGYGGAKCIGFPFFDQQGEQCGIKMRKPEKDFSYVKVDGAEQIGAAQLFGRHVFGDRFDRQVVVTEGEFDAMSVAQAMDFKIACVSVNAGAQTAAKCLKANYLWLDRFAEIILWLDDDEPGRLAAEECAKLFKVGKVRIAKATGFKDASDVLQANKPGDIKSAIYMAQAWRPRGIVNAADSPDDVTKPKEEDQAFAYQWPWPEVNDILGPILPGQVCYHVAGTGIGKSTGVAEVEVSLLKQGAKIGHMGFEDTRRDSKLRIMGVVFSERLDLNPREDAAMVAMHEEVFGSRQVELFDPETAEWTVEAILGYVRYCAKALDCQVIFIDPLTFIAAGLSQGEDERRALDSASRDLAAMSKELGVHLQVTHHLKRPAGTAHEEGAPTSLNEVRGSGGIANFATFVIGHERNQQAEGDQYLLTQLRSLKNRPRSKTGPMLTLKYSMDTGRLMATSEPFPSPGKSGGGERRGGFAPIASDDY